MNGYCEHLVTRIDGERYVYEKTKRDIFTCEEHKTQVDYSDYVAKQKNTAKPPLAHLAAPEALPKYSRGDYPKRRFVQETVRTTQKSKYIHTVDKKGKEHRYIITPSGIMKEIT